MINKFIKGKVYIFIDAANTFYAQRTLGWRMSYEKLIDRVKKRGKWVIVMSTKGHISRELIEKAKYINLKKLKDEIAME